MDSMDSLENINTPADLFKIQTTKPCSTSELVEQLCEPIYVETPAIGLQVIQHLATSLAELHETFIEDSIKEDRDPEIISAWAYDKALLDSVLITLQDIKLWYHSKYSTLFSAMTNLFSNSDLEEFAEYLGLDYDQFYESYYQVHHDETECDPGEISLQVCYSGDTW